MDSTDTDSDFERLQKLFNAVQAITKVGGWEVDLLNDTLFWTEETYRIHDTTPEEYTPCMANAGDFYAPEWVPVITLAFSNAIEKGTDFNHELELITAKSRRIWVQIYGTVTMSQGKVIKITGAFQDITERKKAEQELWRQGNFDFLTELPNRKMFRYCLEQETKKAHRSAKRVALLFIDLGHFKEINDTVGHDVGDTVIKEAARRLASCVRETDTLARLGGDEFTVIVGELDDYTRAEGIANNLLQKLAEPFHIGDEVAYLTASIGITFYPDDATEVDALLKNADQAMYAAKEQGRNRFQYFTSSMQEVAVARGIIANNLRGALNNNEFRLVYQPIVELASGTIHKAEALIRWYHPTRGLINPVDFIHIAEENGMIIDIGEWVFQQTAQQVARWRALYCADFQISVNTSPVQYHDSDERMAQWFDYLQTLGLPGDAIVAEITEGVLMDTHSEITNKLRALRDVGIQISLDDFGTGYSSLSYLRKFDIDYIKIDRSFVHNLQHESRDMALCDAIIVMAQKLGLKVVAEGIETEEHRNLLTAAGCDYGQGYLFSKPVPPEDFERLFDGG